MQCWSDAAVGRCRQQSVDCMNDEQLRLHENVLHRRSVASSSTESCARRSLLSDGFNQIWDLCIDLNTKNRAEVKLN